MAPGVLRKSCESLKSVTTKACDVNPLTGIPSKNYIEVIAGNLTKLESFPINTKSTLKGVDVDALIALPHLKSATLRCP